jgi:outer membrane protein assembly factor BamB
MVTQPTYLPPGFGDGNDFGLVYSTTEAGDVRAIRADRGKEVWQYAVGQPVNEPVIPVGNHLYVIGELGTLFCLDSVKSDPYWTTTDVGQFIAAGKDKVYVADRAGRIKILNAKTGAVIDRLRIGEGLTKLRNQRTDRIYLASRSGLIQCLHETGQAKPLYHRKKEGADKPAEKAPEPAVKPKEAPTPFGEPAEDEPEEEEPKKKDEPENPFL